MINTVELIYDQFEKENEPRVRKERHYPSSLCATVDGVFDGKCRRATVYSIRNIEASNPIEPVALFKMSMGNAIHDYVDGVMNRALERVFGGDVEIIGTEVGGAEEAFLWKAKGLKLPISGRMDKILKIKDKVVVFEWKSTYMSGIKFIQQHGAKVDNMLQAMAYLEQDVFPVDGLVLMYIARDTGYLYGFYIEKEGDHLKMENMSTGIITIVNINWKIIKKELKIIEKHLKDGTIPDRDYEAFVNPKLNKLMVKSDWHCRYCNFRGLCYGCEG